MAEVVQALDEDTKEGDESEQSSFIVKLNVGGLKYVTTKTTLCKSKYFSGLLSGNFRVQNDEDGNLFIDRNGEYFGYILEYLRSGYTVFPRSLLIPLQIESDFYQITFDLNQKDSMHSKLPLHIFATDCSTKQSNYSQGHRMGNVFKVNGRWFDQSMCQQYGLQAVLSKYNNFKWPELADGTGIHSALQFACYLVDRGWYTLESEESQVFKLNKIAKKKQDGIAVISDDISARLSCLRLD